MGTFLNVEKPQIRLVNEQYWKLLIPPRCVEKFCYQNYLRPENPFVPVKPVNR